MTSPLDLDPNALGEAACLTPAQACLTSDMELFIGDLGLQVDPAPLLCVVHPAEAGDVDHTLLVHVHITGCESRKQRVRLGIWAQTIAASVFCWTSISENELSSNLILCYNVFGDTKNC